MYVLAPNQTAEKYPYSINELRRDNPNTSFPLKPSEELLAEWSVYPVILLDQPSHNEFRERVLEDDPRFEDGKWIQTWRVVPLSEEESEEKKKQHNASVKQARLFEYSTYSDPLFFKYQRGEATKEEWLEAVQLIKDSLPYVE